MELNQLVSVIDHTNIWPQATPEDIKRLCHQARLYKFGCVCVNPVYVKLAGKLLKGTPTRVGSTCGFPFGAHRTELKVLEAETAISDGAREIDMVMNIGALKGKKYTLVGSDIKKVSRLCRKNRVTCKVILEVNLLTPKEKTIASKIACREGVDFIKTGTGLWGPAKLADVRLMRRIASPKTGVKAAGGIRTYRQVQRFLGAGATRIGTSSGISIVKDFLRTK